MAFEPGFEQNRQNKILNGTAQFSLQVLHTVWHGENLLRKKEETRGTLGISKSIEQKDRIKQQRQIYSKQNFEFLKYSFFKIKFFTVFGDSLLQIAVTVFPASLLCFSGCADETEMQYMLAATCLRSPQHESLQNSSGQCSQNTGVIKCWMGYRIRLCRIMGLHKNLFCQLYHTDELKYEQNSNN